MLHLDDITKKYTGKGVDVQALKGVTVTFRESEFVSILGPSGCGKTTLLNIIGGLDHYTTGDLVIDGVSTKQYSDRDWDTYRNHRIGFIFQSYNLIPHQTVAENVELALTIAGMPKAERVQRAKDALDKVGLGGLYNKKPNQLSGGQCQRVAIARALVGDPDILLADEPTGALDTVTSVQIMDLIKEISKERLVIMVTHNPELAEKYSTRIINLLDGRITGDSDPVDILGAENSAKFVPAEKNIEAEAAEEQSAPDAAAENVDTAAPEGAANGGAGDGAEQGGSAEAGKAADGQTGGERIEKSKLKKSKLSAWSAFRLSGKNLLSKLKRTILVCFAGSIGIIGVTSVLAVSTGVTNYIDKMQNDMLSGNPITIQETALNMEGLTAMQDTALKADAVKNSVVDGKINVNYLIQFLAERSDDLSSLVMTNDMTQDYVDYVRAMPENYYASLDFRYGIDMSNNMYTDYHFTGHDGEVMSLSAAQNVYTSLLGKTDFAEYAPLVSMVAINYMQAPENPDFIATQYDIISEGGRIATAENEIMIVVDKDTQLTDLFLAQLGYYDQDQFLNIAYKTKDSEGYDPQFDKDRFDYSEILGKKFTWYPNDTVFAKNTNPMTATANPFNYSHVASSDWENGIELTVSAILRPKADLSYGCLKSGIYYTPALTQKVLENAAHSDIVKHLVDNKSEQFTSGHLTVGGMEIDAGLVYKYDFTYDGTKYDEIGYVGSKSQISSILGSFGGQMGNIASGLSDTYNLTLRNLGGETLPSTIAIYSSDFNNKDLVTAYLNEWNSKNDIEINGRVIKADEREDINYTDTIALIIDLVNNLITTITASLIAFTALSLVVSTVMIAIITYVSVIERVKEIGVIRSLGGRKRDVSFLFTAETFIIGLASGLLGILVTFFITLIINAVINSIAPIGAIATLTAPIIFIMLGVSIGLTLISGLIPARLAARKDPAEALRSE